MNGKTERQVGRRGFIKGAGAATAGLILSPYVISATARAQNKVVFVNTWGGSWTAAEEAAFFTPFTKATGIQVKTVTPVTYAKLKAQVQSGQYEWDVTGINQTQWRRAELEGLVEPIDWKIVDKNKLPPDGVFANGIAYCALATNLCYNKAKYPNGGPQNWADFWNVEKFPGNRSLYGGDAHVTALQGLMGDGVAPNKIYPLDVDRAFKSLEKIKKNIKVWWTQGNQSQQLLRDGEIDMMSIWNARASELNNQGGKYELVWAGATLSITMWGVAKGAPNKGAAWEFIQFAVQPEPQAEFAKRLYYGPTNPKAFDFIPQDIATQLPTYPKYKEIGLTIDPIWGSENIAKLDERFTELKAS